MAIINCPECKKEISDKAATCPNCAYPLNTGGEKVQDNGQKQINTQLLPDTQTFSPAATKSQRDVLLSELKDAVLIIKRVEELQSKKESIDQEIIVAQGEKYNMEKMKIYLPLLICPFTSVGLGYYLGHKYSDIGAFIGLVLGIILGNIIAKILDAALFKTNRCKKANQYYKDKVAPIEKSLVIITDSAKRLVSSPQFKKAQDMIPNDYFDSESARYIYKYIENRRSDTLKEAINMYEDYLHKSRLEEMQKAQTIAVQEGAIAQQKTAAAMQQQAAYSRQLAENSKNIAHYTRSTARATKLNTFINIVKK